MDIKEIRKANLVNQLAIYAARGWHDKDFAKHVGLSPQQLNQLKRGHKNMGSSIARRIETSLDLENGYFDKSHSQKQLSGQLDTLETKEGKQEHTVSDEAMVPVFKPGERIYYDPKERPIPGKPAVIKLNDVITIRTYREEFDGSEVKGFWVPENSSYPEIPFDSAEFLGRAVIHVVKL